MSRGVAVGLNAAQRAAVEHDQGPLLVLAGAGSGKTRVITHRVARLLERTRPDAVLAVSFTNKAAAEMAERLRRIVPESRASKVWLSTFHSFGVRFLGEERRALGYDGAFVVFDQGDSLGLIRDLLRAERGGERKLDAGAILARISLWKNGFVAPNEIPDNDFEYDAVARDVYPKYEHSLRVMRAVDFDDLVCLPVRILREREDIRDKWQRRFHHLMVDEFQDTNRAQLELVRLLANELRNVCVVGDDDQSIYGWRGADVRNILEFERHFPGARVVKLEDNYRSRAPILAVANAAIGQGSSKRHLKVLRAARGNGPPVRLCSVTDTIEEARLVVSEIRALVKDGVPYRGFGVLYRSNLQARLLEEELRAGGIPYTVFGGTQFFDRKEVKDAAAYLRAVVNPKDELSLRRILNWPARGIGPSAVERLERFALAHGISLADALGRTDQMTDLAEAAKRGARSLRAALDQARHSLREGVSLVSAARTLFTEAGVDNELKHGGGGEPSNVRRYENLEYLIGSLGRYEQNEHEQKPSLDAFLNRITLRYEREEEQTNRVTLSTLHTAKGLEFDVVFLVGCVEGQLPHSRTTDPKVTEAAPSDPEEERRLFYVGVTRARDRLYLTHPQRRTMRGRVTPLTRSRFLEGLPNDALEVYQSPVKQTLELDEVAAMAEALLAKLAGNT